MKKYILFITIAIMVAGAIFALLDFLMYQPRTVVVLSREYGDTAYKEYYLSIPGIRSTCTWNYVQDGKSDSFTTYPDQQTGQHVFLYSSDVSGMKVTCLNDQGVEYVGRFSN